MRATVLGNIDKGEDEERKRKERKETKPT